MANALERFAQELVRLQTKAKELSDEDARFEQQIAELQARQQEVKSHLREVTAESHRIADSYNAPIAHPTPDRTTPEDTKPIFIEIEDDENASITVTPRSTRSRPPTPPQQTPNPQQTQQPAQFDVIHPNYPTVVFLDGAWTEVWCGSCENNVMERGQRFFDGVKGISHHGIKVHKAEDYRLQNVITTCGRRVLVDGEIAEMEAGRHPGVKMRLGAPATKTQSALPARAGAGKSTSSVTQIAPGASDNGSVSTVAPQLLVKLPARSPPASTVGNTTSNAPVEKRPTVYEEFQALQAEAQAAGTPKARKKRTSAGRPKHTEVEESDSDWEEQPLRKRFG